MTDIEIDPDLLRAKVDFYTLDTAHATFCASLPAEPDDEQRAQLHASQQALTEAALVIHRHPAFEGLSQMDRYKLDVAASKAARASL